MNYVATCAVQMIESGAQPDDAELSDALANRNILQAMVAPVNSCKAMQNKIGAGTIDVGSSIESDDKRTIRLGDKNESKYAVASSDFTANGIDSAISNHYQSSTSQPWSLDQCSAPVATYNEHSCVQYVERYCRETSQYKMLWASDDHTKGQVKILRNRRAKRKCTSNCIVDLDLDLDLSSSFQIADFNVFKRVGPMVTSGSSSRVGSNYQAWVPKTPFNKSLHEFRCSNSCSIPFLLWNPQLAQKAEYSGEDIEGFLSKSDNLNVSILLMDALRTGKYNVQKATEIFVAHFNEPNFLLDYGNADAFAETFTTDHFAKTKDFDFVVSKLSCSKEAALINYYRWKNSNPNRPEQYLQMKQERHKESNVCEICDNGGALIVCDFCSKAYHCHCLTPQLTIIPHGEWFCPECESRSPANLRRHMGYHKISCSSPEHKRSRTSQSLEFDDCLNSALQQRFESLKFIHKELYSGLEKPLIRPQISLSSASKYKVKQATYSPSNMIWDNTRGFWIENETLCRDASVHANKTKQNEMSNGTKQKEMSNGTKQKEMSNGRNCKLVICSSSTYDDDIDPINNNEDESWPEDTQLTSGSALNMSTDSVVDTPVLLRGQTYEVKIPVTPEGLLIYIEKRSGRFTSFSGYRQSSTGQIGIAQEVGAFMANGDFILEIDNVSCFEKSFAEVRSLLKISRPGTTMRILKMFHPLDVSKHVMS